MTEQLELPLWETLRSAQLMSEQVDFEGLLIEVEEAISQVPESEQLRLAGEAFLWLAEVYAARSGTWMAEWEQASRDPMVEQIEAETAKKEEALAIAHDENVSAWVEAIARWLEQTAAGQVQFAQLCQGVGMPRIEVWLGVLLGRFELESQGEFYSGLFWVRGCSSGGTDITKVISLP